MIMKHWRAVNTDNRVSILSRQTLKSVNNDLTKLNVSQRNMIAAVAMRDDPTISEDVAMYQYDVARSSLGFARTILRFCSPQMPALVLSGGISVHVLDDLRRSLGENNLNNHLLSMSDENIKETYNSKRRMTTNRHNTSTRKRKTTTSADTVTHTPTVLTPSQLKAQHAANVRWGKDAADKAVKELPIVSSENPVIAEWSHKTINRAFKIVTTANDLAVNGDIEGARQLMKAALPEQ